MEQAKYAILPNGLRVIIRNMLSHRSLTLIVVVGAGPRFEDDSTSGLAHFLEHMLFEGTTRFNSPKKLAEYIESKGGKSWAFTEKESVNYGVKVKKENYELAISYLNEILFNSLLHESEIEKEKRIITEEIKKKMDNPETEVWDNYFSFIFGEKNSLGRSTLGSLKSVGNLNRDKIKKYFKKVKYYFFNLKMIQKYKYPFVIQHIPNVNSGSQILDKNANSSDSYCELNSGFNLCHNYVFYLGSDVILHYSDKYLDKSDKRQIINLFLKENIESHEKGFHLLEHIVGKSEIENLQIKLLIKFGMIDTIDDLYQIKDMEDLHNLDKRCKNPFKWTSEQINEILNWCSYSDEDILDELIVYYGHKNLIFTEDF